jgi:predicted MFS family arabinose efflux permease
MAVPLCKIIFVALGGLLADMGLNFVAGFMFLSLLISNVFWHKHKLLHTLHLKDSNKIWHILESSKRFMLITLSALFNALNVPVRFVFMPLYFFEQSGGSATKLGGFLALFGLVGLIAQILRKKAVGKTLNTYSIMLYGILIYAFVPLFWFVFYESPWVVACLMMFGQVVSVLWSYGYFVELRKISEDTPTLVNQQWQIVNGFFVGVFCLFLTVISYDLMAHIKIYLMVQFFILILFIGYFSIWWRRHSIKKEV